MSKHTPPTHVGDCEVYVHDPDNPLSFQGEDWVTLCPEDGDDERLWEFSITTGRNGPNLMTDNYGARYQQGYDHGVDDALDMRAPERHDENEPYGAGYADGYRTTENA